MYLSILSARNVRMGIVSNANANHALKWHPFAMGYHGIENVIKGQIFNASKNNGTAFCCAVQTFEKTPNVAIKIVVGGMNANRLESIKDSNPAKGRTRTVKLEI